MRYRYLLIMFGLAVIMFFIDVYLFNKPSLISILGWIIFMGLEAVCGYKLFDDDRH